MTDNRLPTKALYCLVEGTRNRGKQTKTWMDTLDNTRQDLAQKDVDMRSTLDTRRDRKNGNYFVETCRPSYYAYMIVAGSNPALAAT